MNLLLDECLPRKLKAMLTGHTARTVPEMGWAGIKNGKLLALMEPVFDVFVTVDKNMRFQQDMTGRRLILVVLSVPNNTLRTLLTLMPQVLAARESAQPGQVIEIAAGNAA